MDHSAVFTGAIAPTPTTTSIRQPRAVARCGAGVRLQQKLSDIAGGRGRVRVRHWDQQLHVFILFSASSTLRGLSTTSSRLQLSEWTVIVPGLVLIILAGSGQVPGETVQVLGQPLQGSRGRSSELCSAAAIFNFRTGGNHGNGAGRGRGISGPISG